LFKRSLPVLLIFLLFECYGQQYLEQIYTAESGLPTTYVFGSYVRSNGELMVGTANGFSRFNGISFINYGYETGLSNLMVHAQYEDSNKNLWVGTDVGMQLFEGGKCITYPTSDNSIPGYVGSFIEYNNQLWVHATGGVYYLKNKVWQKAPYKELTAGCTQIIKYNGGLLFCYRTKTYFLKNGSLTRFNLFDDLNYYIVRYINNNFYVLTNDSKLLLLQDGKAPLLIYKESTPIITNFDYCMNALWIFFESKPMLKIDLKTGHRKTFSHITNPQGIHCRNNILWIGGLHGLAKITEYENVTFLNGTNNINYRMFIPDRAGNYTLTHGPNNLFNKYDGKQFKPIDIKLSKQWHGFLLDKGIKAEPNKYWIISRFSGLYKLDLNQKRISQYDSVLVYDVAYDSISDKTYFSTREKIFILNQQEKIIDSINFPKAFILKTLKDGRLLFYCNQSLYILKNGQLKKCWKTTLPIFRKWDIQIAESNSGLISLLIKGNGIKIYKWSEDTLKEHASISVSTGLRSSTPFVSIFDSFDRLWILSDYGVSIADIKTRLTDQSVPLRNLGTFGISVPNWEQCNISLAHDNKLLLSTPSVTAIIDTKDFRVTEPAEPVFIESLQIQNSLSESEENKQILFPTNSQIRFNEGNHSFKVKFQSVSFSNSSEIVYSYRLVNENDSTWSTPGTSSSVTFFKLPAGEYVFEVRAKKPNTEWSSPAKFAFTITPPFWRTNLFKIIVGLNLAFLVWFIFQSRLKKIRRSAYVKSKLSDLEMKALRAQLNPHFIYNALNSIQSLISSGKQKDAMRYVSKFGKLLRLILEHSEEGKTSLQKEIDVNSLYIQLEQLRLGFDFAVHINIADEIVPEEEKVPALIIQPIIENALWHGLTNSKEDKHLTIDISATDVYLIIGICDNGLGINATTSKNLTSSEKRKSFGSQIVRKRLLTYNNDNQEPVHIRDLKEIGKQGTEVKLLIRRYIN
jgi:hypothetical protein